MDHGKRGPQRRAAEPDRIDLGDEPPLSADGGTGSIIDRRRVSLRWYSGTILTGLCGAALMGGAVYASLDGESTFGATPERVEVLRGSLGATAERAASPRKTDKLQAFVEAASPRQLMRIATTTRVGEREIVKMRPFVRVASNLSLSLSELSANVPPFNAARMMASAATGPTGAPASEDSPGIEPDGEISFVMRDLATVLPKARVVATLAMDDVMARVRDAAEYTGSLPRPSMASMQPNMALGYASTGDSAPDPYAGFETRIVPENITLLPKTASQATGGNGWNERTVTVKKGENVTTILRELGATAEEAKGIASALGPRGRDGGLKEGHKLRVLLAQTGTSQRAQPIRVIVAGESTVEAVVAFSDLGKYVSVDVQNADTQVAEAPEDDENDTTAVRLYQSIYETALRQHVPRAMVDELIRIYAYDFDFQRRVQPGDSFELFYGDEEADSRSEVLFTSLTVGGETKRYYRFQTQDDSVVDYYDETGKSAKKFLTRKPVSEAVMRSGFGWRRHPILGYSKMHTGVDWATQHGSPIYASGHGMVETAGWTGAYGKYVKIKHSNGYVTAYGHMSAFARGIQPGTRVRQGQVIGYVGSTGRSTGPHVHYEIMVNGRFVDPMRIKLPRGRVLEGPILAGFEKERDRVDGMITRAPAPVAQSAPPPERTARTN